MPSEAEHPVKRGDRPPLPRTLLLAAWFALVTGLAEWAYVLLLERKGIPLQVVSEHLGWMAPLANLPLFLALAVLLWLASGWHRLEGRPLLTAGCVGLSIFAVLTTVHVLHVLAVLVLSLGIGVQASRTAAEGDSWTLFRLARRTLPAVLLLVVIAGAFRPIRSLLTEERGISALIAPDDDRPNVLLIILDTVRAKSLSLYGYEKPTTPYLERLGGESIVFERAIATSPWTLPSHGSMFTGRLPRDLSATFSKPLDDSFPTLAEELTRRGYVTAGFVANLGYVGREFGLARGFVHYEDHPLSPGQVLLSSSLWRQLTEVDLLRSLVGLDDLLSRKSARDLADDFLAWLDGREAERPFFAFLNLFDAHEPYLPPTPFDTLFGPGSERGALEYETSLLGGHKAGRAPKQESTPAEWAADLAAYEGAIAYMDRELERLIDELRRRGVLDRTLLVIASDHGELHGEHGMYEHTSGVYLPLIRVPLLVRPPGGPRPAVRVEGTVSLVDLPATVMDLLGFGTEHPFPGRSLGHEWRRTDASSSSDTALSEHAEPIQYTGGGRWVRTYPGPVHSAVTDRHHYIRVEGENDELYNLEADPGEQENLALDPTLAPVIRLLHSRTMDGLDPPLEKR